MIGLQLEHIAWALAIAVIAYIVREIRRWRNEVRPQRPDMVPEEAWREWQAGLDDHPDRRLIPPAHFGMPISEAVRADAEQGLMRMDRRVTESDLDERFQVRRMILAQATLSLQLEAIADSDEDARSALIKGYEPGMDEILRNAIAGSIVKWAVLRHYARWKFDDAVPNDWFQQYMDLARPYVREKVRLATDYVIQADPAAGRFAAVYDTLLAELREKMLKTRPKRRFVRPDLPWEKPVRN